MAKLKRLKIEKFRNVVPGTELVFNDGFNVLLGQNGTGKTTLLRLMAMALSSDFSALEEEPFAIEWEVATEAGSVTVKIGNQPNRDERIPDPLAMLRAISSIFPEGDEAATWYYKVKLESVDGKFMGLVEANPLGATATPPGDGSKGHPIPVVAPFERVFLFDVLLDLLQVSAPDVTETQVHMIQDAVIGIRGRFDEALGGFDAMTGSGRNDADLLNDSAITVKMRGERVIGGRSRFTYAPAYLFNALEQATVGADSITLGHRELRFLSKAIELCDFQRGDMLLMLESKTVETNASTLRYGKFAFTFTLDDASAINHDALSYGQKRLLSFLYHLDVNKDIIIADELVNGLHYDWIEACIDEIGDRQAFLTSQNPLLLDFLHFESAEEARRSFILCRREKRDGKTVTVWENLDEATAEAFFRAYQTRALQVSEILRTKGLW